MMASVRLAATISQFVSAAIRELRGAFEDHEGKLSCNREVKIMKVFTILAVSMFSMLLLAIVPRTSFDVSAQNAKKPPETMVLAKEAKLGPVEFNHLAHITKNRSADGTKPIACVECHHTAQPASEAVKHPPHKTVWPADRTSTLTAELLEKGPAAPAVNLCTDCHARADTKPKLLPEIPKLTFEGSAEPTVLNNQQAFHRACGSCHDAAMKARPDLTPAPPTSKKCVACHKKATA
jgi:cytochrome c553